MTRDASVNIYKCDTIDKYILRVCVVQKFYYVVRLLGALFGALYVEFSFFKHNELI